MFTDDVQSSPWRCPSNHWTTFSDPCVVKSWSTLAPFFLVLLSLVYSTSTKLFSAKSTSTRRISALDGLKRISRPFLTIQEAEILLDKYTSTDEHNADPVISKPSAYKGGWKAYAISLLGLVQTLVWLAVATYALVDDASTSYNLWECLLAFVSAGTWLYITLYPTLCPIRTVPLRLAFIAAFQLLGCVLRIAGIVYQVGTGHGESRVGNWGLVGEIANGVVTLALVGVVYSMPIAIPGEKIGGVVLDPSTSPEDYCSLFSWLTFNWVHPLISKGRSDTLNEDDVWTLSPTFQSRLLYDKFMSIPNLSLMKRIWQCNVYDVCAQFILVYIGIVFQFAGPFFLKRILSAIDQVNDDTQRPMIYVLAFCAFIAQVLKAETDLQHLWHSRRIATRVRTELMAAIYDKSLKRKDFSGVVNQSASTSDSADDTKAGKDEASKNEPKAGADTGKIVNLMATDATTISNLFEGMYMFYAAPLQLVIAAVMLYELLGACGFIGFLILVLFIPLNKFLFSLTVDINKGLTSARDTRMAVLTELIGSIKFIKFFAWEGEWVKRVAEKREAEMRWLVKSRWTMLALDTVWSLPPALVSVISFLAYVSLGNHLTVSAAFTSLSLFAMIQQPLTFFSYFIVKLIQTKVSLQRISKFLEEDEVTPQVSSLKYDAELSRPPSSDEESFGSGLGIENGTFKWNEIDESSSPAGTATPSTAKGKEAATKPQSDGLASSSSSVMSASSNQLASSRFELRDISIMFPEGQLTVVTGPTASGKTALLLAVLGELTLLSGRIVMSKDPTKLLKGGLTQAISYAAQTPWLRHQSIRENIVFDSEWDEARYEAVVDCCALGPDFDVLEDGDETEIGSKGVSLSGGQKARVALARAVYARTKYVLLDDPLSAVDSHTARFLFEKLFCGPLLQGRTVVLVTHHVDLVLSGAHYLIRMQDGHVDIQGTVKALRKDGLIDKIKEEEEELAASQEAKLIPEDDTLALKVEEPTADAPVLDKSTKKKLRVKKSTRKLVEDEHREVGSVKWDIYKTYLRASTYTVWAVVMVLIALFQANTLMEKYWIKTWGESYRTSAETPQLTTLATTPRGWTIGQRQDIFDVARFFTSTSSNTQIFGSNLLNTTAGNESRLPDASVHPFFYIGLYAAFVSLSALLRTCAASGEYIAATIAGRRLFRELLMKIVKATMRWYDTTPSGRILNRFGKDIETLDDGVAQSIWIVNVEAMGLVAIISMISSIFPLFIIPALIIGYLYFDLAVGYLSAGRDLRRMESNTRSPIFSDFSEVLEGIVTVRAFSAERRFLHNMHKKIDLTTKMNYMTWMTNRWLLVRFDVLGGLTVLLTTLFAVSGYVSAGTAGLCITSATSFTMSVYWLCRFWTKMELDLNSVERIVEYLDVPEEPPAIIESSRPPAYWPSNTTHQALVQVEELNIKYAPELPSVIHDVSLELRAGERIGLLGRTGSGKSTLAMSLLRFVEPAGGRIIIDGIDISKIGVSDLRSRMTFIPQDAALFSGTIRENLDPFNEHDDGECLDALHRVQILSDEDLASQHPSRGPSASATPRASTPDPAASLLDNGDLDTVHALETSSVLTTPRLTLSTMVSASGTNFSQGQRQLLAMARALLRRSSIVIMDEATSSIDFQTDEKIQTAIREEFVGALLITIAHRLRTVIDYDRLIVLDKGKVVEFDTPFNLISKEGGILRDMCLKSGSFDELMETVEKNAELVKPSA